MEYRLDKFGGRTGIFGVDIICRDDLGIESLARRFTAMKEPATTRIPALHKTGDGTVFRVVAGDLARNGRISGGDEFFLDLSDTCSGG